MDDFIIRSADKNDVKPLADMDKICFNLPWSEKSFFEEIIRNKIARYVIAEVAGKVVGYAGIWMVLDEGHITNVAVHPEFRRQGIAKAMFASLFEISQSAGIKVYTLEVRASDESAISLYRYLGFIEYGIRKNYYHDNNEDAVLMWRS
jgi:ribosomal-protein-alanine N-acetyltransferase